MEVIKYPDPRLLKPCKEVILITPELIVLLDSMWETMLCERGMGMAANQVALDYRMFVMKTTKEEKLYLINPEILECGKNPCSLPEGCLSAPGQQVKLYRPNWVKISFLNEKGEKQTRVFFELDAVCVQHEIEHLEGKSFLQNKAIPKKLRIALASKWGLKIR